MASGDQGGIDWRIRPAQAEDAPAVAAILLASYPALMAPAYHPALLARALPLITRPNPRLLGSGTWFIAEADGEPAACGGWSLLAPGARRAEPGVAHIRHFATAARWTGRGIARRLYERSEIQARAAGIRLFHCFASLNAESFYAAMGFSRISFVQVPLGPDLFFPSIHMSRPLGG
jgi:GNAT superfamily N-acetyltransferase